MSADDDSERPSRSAKRRAARDALHASRDVVAALAALSAERYDALPLDPDLRREIDIARRLGASGARQRQIASIAKRIDDGEQSSLERMLRGFQREDLRAKAHDAMLEAWRRRLIEEGDVALEDLLSLRPDADRVRLRILARDAREPDDVKARRALYRALRALFAG